MISGTLEKPTQSSTGSLWRERRWELGAAVVGIVLSALWRNRPLPFQGVACVAIVAAAAALLFVLRTRLRMAYAMLELFMAAALAWHASTTLQAAAAIYVAVRGLDNMAVGLPPLLQSAAWGRLMHGRFSKPPPSGPESR